MTCLDRPEGPDCYEEGSCCVNDVCVQSTKFKCDLFNGFFIPDMKCEGDGITVESLGGCPEPCDGRGSCCINNICYSLTKEECSFQFNSTWLPDPCYDPDTGDMVTNCCLEVNIGACCFDETCYETSALDCSKLRKGDETRGVFWGVGSSCAGPYGMHRTGNIPSGRYAAHTCVINDAGDIGGILMENGFRCETTGSEPPCPECIGWTQQVSETCVDEETGVLINPCACGELENRCPCANETEDWGCNKCGRDSLSCGSIVLVDGTCWECCCNSEDIN